MFSKDGRESVESMGVGNASEVQPVGMVPAPPPGVKVFPPVQRKVSERNFCTLDGFVLPRIRHASGPFWDDLGPIRDHIKGAGCRIEDQGYGARGERRHE